ncbi:hypothetical protein ACFYXS_02730 [Streptomyces sp. NPDC002574]|uniref:hypothetical protein n=1 Tax=Streptomyces sp. NPDC002574 TaxID=3364652 RepID=UPI0036BA778B
MIYDLTTANLMRFVGVVLDRHDDHLCNEGPTEQGVRMLKRIDAFVRHTPLRPVFGMTFDLAGFGCVPVHFESDDAKYVLLSECAEELGWSLPKAHEWAERQYQWDIVDQRRADEERGDGRLGYEGLRGYVDLQLDLIMDDPEAKPDSSGAQWSTAGDWLVSSDRLPWLLSCSPWGQEFFMNTVDAFSHAFVKNFGEQLKDVPTYGTDGQPTGGNALEDLFHTDLTEEEALRKARRGPSLDVKGDGQ